MDHVVLPHAFREIRHYYVYSIDKEPNFKRANCRFQFHPASKTCPRDWNSCLLLLEQFFG